MSFYYRPPAFSISRDKVLNNLRVENPTTLKLPANAQIVPNSPVPGVGNKADQ